VNEFGTILARLDPPGSYPVTLATLAKVEGSSYRRAGARLLLDATGARAGSISGGCLEEDLLARMHALSPARPREVVVYDTTTENDLVWGVGLGCHGVVHVVVERFESPPGWLATARERHARRETVELWIDATGTQLPNGSPGPDVFKNRISPPIALVICGAGDDARPLARLAKTLGWTVTVVDPRPAHATVARFLEADAVRCLPPEDVSRAIQWDSRTAAVIMTHHYRFDRPLLAQLLTLELPYLGLLGPKLRGERLLADARADGVAPTTAALAGLRAPVGLDLGGDGPEAVALAILAEIQAVFAARDARPLRERQRAIHAT
jgi:xanthine dehydrogenase accessory factor